MSETKKTTQYEDFENFFSKSLKESDPKLYDSLAQEFSRQQEHIELIASENIVSRSVLDAQGSIMTNKYAEGYSGRRYYGGCEYVDLAEDLAISRACELFESKFAKYKTAEPLLPVIPIKYMAFAFPLAFTFTFSWFTVTVEIDAKRLWFETRSIPQSKVVPQLLAEFFVQEFGVVLPSVVYDDLYCQVAQNSYVRTLVSTQN